VAGRIRAPSFTEMSSPDSSAEEADCSDLEHGKAVAGGPVTFNIGTTARSEQSALFRHRNNADYVCSRVQALPPLGATAALPSRRILTPVWCSPGDSAGLPWWMFDVRLAESAVILFGRSRSGDVGGREKLARLVVVGNIKADRAAGCVGVMSDAEFSAFYRQHLSSVYGYLLRLCAGNRARAEDLSQDVWFKLVEELRRGHRERANVRRLISVARSRFIDDARRERRSESKLALLEGPRESDAEPTGDDVLNHLEGLPAMYRAALILRYVDDLPIAEVAATFGLDVGATNSLLFRARSTLRRLHRRDADV
jgi:RNA polymerase sigma-70 factor (ECF subfamily)